jgi:hypothetical protein
MLVGRDGQLYVIDPANSDSPLTEPLYFMRDDLDVIFNIIIFISKWEILKIRQYGELLINFHLLAFI